jgi:hypothetical protein
LTDGPPLCSFTVADLFRVLDDLFCPALTLSLLFSSTAPPVALVVDALPVSRG